MKLFQFFSIALFSLLTFAAQAQNGTFRGQVFDENSNEKLIGATVRCLTSPAGAYTDLEGSFSFSLPAGTHSIEISYLGITKTVTDIEIKSGETTFLEIPFSTKVESVDAVKVTATRITNTNKALDVARIKEVSLTDGVSGQQARKAGATDAAQMTQQIPGLSVQGGKYVYVRGLGDRYTKTILNGMIIPGLDPDRNTVQMDIFPSNILDNIIVYKTFTPDLPGDWAGGVVDINTKAFPNTKTQTIGFSLSYNPAQHFQSDYLASSVSNTDWLGFDDGSRALPISKDINLAREYDPALNDPKLTEFTRSFNNELSPVQRLNVPDFRLSYSLGDQINKGDTTYGYSIALNYKKTTDFYDSVYYGTFIKSQNPEVNEMLLDRDAYGPQSNQNVTWSAMLGGAYKLKSNRYTVNLLHIQNGETRAADLIQEDYRENPSLIFKNNLEYTQRSVTNLILTGRHEKDSSPWAIDWKLSPTYSRIYEPDIKLTAFELTDDIVPKFVFRLSAGAEATRTYRYLNEWNYNARVDFERKMKLRNGRESKLRFGMLETFKMRDFEILNYQFRLVQPEKFNWTGDANELLIEENIWTVNPMGEDSGVYVTGNPEPANTFSAQQNVLGIYAMQELPLSNKLLLIYGARLEKADNFYTGQNQQGVIYDRAHLLDELNVLPSVNFKYEVFEREDRTIMNFRVSYSRTLARPSFKELSNAQIQDRISGRTFIGNDSLVQTEVDNVDLRLEYFGKYSQMASFSAFYKNFSNPIELVAYNATSPNDFQPRNVGNASIYGVELELRKKLNFASDTFYITALGLNSTFVYSSVEMTKEERVGRQSAAREGEVIGTHRDMVGQSPYIINAYVNYTHIDKGWDATLTYNVQGPRLAVVGVARNPDVYDMPFHSLTFRISKEFGENDKFQLNFTAKNILNSEKYSVYRSYQAEDQMFSWMLPQRSFSLGFRYNLD